MFINLLRKKSYVLATISFLLLTGCGGSSITGSADNINDGLMAVAGANNSYTEITDQEKALLKSINDARAVGRDCNDGQGFRNATYPLYWNTDLYASALEHSTDLALSNTFSHSGSGTASDITGNGSRSLFYQRIVANGYNNYYSVGENIAGGQRTIEEVTAAWLASPGHCANIMSDRYTEVGVAIVTNTNSTYGIYWTQNFGSKRQ